MSYQFVLYNYITFHSSLFTATSVWWNKHFQN